MATNIKTLFEPSVAQSELHDSFKLFDQPGNIPARTMLDQIYQEFDDPDGNFLQQFQTTGFDARFFELYLFAYFLRSGYIIDRSHTNPDFIVSRNNLTVAVEATTVNPSTSGTLAEYGRKIKELSIEQLKDYFENELPIRFGSPLHSKLTKKYWELPHCKNMPLVIAIEAFHEEYSFLISGGFLAAYLYGLLQNGYWETSGDLTLFTEFIKEHSLESKKIPSQFFAQPNTEYISAILFTNSGTKGKFDRMGFQHGFGCDIINIIRQGFCFNPEQSAKDPTLFSYNLDDPPFIETWGQGLIVFHNPNCINPIPRDFFVDAAQCYLEEDKIQFNYDFWHPINSSTMNVYLGKLKPKIAKIIPKMPRTAIGAIHRDEFTNAYVFSRHTMNQFGEEQGWFADDTGSFLGVIIRDNQDNDWGFVVLGRDEYMSFRAIDIEMSIASREEAVIGLQMRIARYLSNPKRIFTQGTRD